MEKVQAVAFHTTERCPSAWLRLPVRWLMTTRRGNTSSSSGQQLKVVGKRQAEVEESLVYVWLVFQQSLQTWGWKRVPVPSKGWGETWNYSRKATSLRSYQWVCWSPNPEQGNSFKLFFFLPLLRLKWAPGFVPSWAPFHQDQETHQEVRGGSAVPWPCLPSLPAPLKAEVSPCATKTGKIRIARRGSASLARRNRTNHCKKLRLSEFQHSQAGRKESTGQSTKHPAGPKKFVNSSFVAYTENIFFSSPPPVLNVICCFHSPHSYVIFRGTSSLRILIYSSHLCQPAAVSGWSGLARAQIQVEFSSSPPNHGWRLSALVHLDMNSLFFQDASVSISVLKYWCLLTWSTLLLLLSLLLFIFCFCQFDKKKKKIDF